LVTQGNNASSALLRRRRQKTDTRRERRKKVRSKSAEGRKPKTKAKKKRKNKSPLPPIAPKGARVSLYPHIRPHILVSHESSDFSMSPVKTTVRVDPSMSHYDDKLNQSLENLGLHLTRPLVRLGSKPLFVVDTGGKHSVYKKLSLTGKRSSYDNLSRIEFCMREYMFMRELQGHPNIVTVVSAFADDENMIINMEFTDKGDLFTIVDGCRQESTNGLAFNEKKAKYVIRQILLGVSYMHHKNMAHRDLKLENVLYFEQPHKAIKICDFEFTCNVETDSIDILGMFMGSWCVISPEFVKAAIKFGTDVEQLRTEFQLVRDGEPSNFAWDWRKSDIWACGVMLYTCLHGGYPYYGLDADDRENIGVLSIEINSPFPYMSPLISQPCRDVIMAMLHKDHTTRKSADEILEMDWFNGVGGLSRSRGSSVSPSVSASSL
jgi:serine/threonine protein kinase